MKITTMMNDTRTLTRLAWLLLAALVSVGLVFGGFYYWDRYVHLNDRTPFEVEISELKAALHANPDSPEPRLALAETYLRNKDYPAAIEQALPVLEAYPDSDRALLVLGLAEIFSGDSDSGAKFLERFVGIRHTLSTAEIDPALEMGLYYLGDSYIKLGRPDDAIAALSQALVISPTDADALYLLGVASQMIGNHDQAVAHFEHAARFVPDFSEAYAGMVESYSALNKPAYMDYANGMQMFSQEQYTQARKLLSSAVEQLPEYAPAYTGLGLTLEKLGDLQSAKVMLERAVGIDSHDFLASNTLQRVNLALEETP